jgi:hypothetical protein
MSFDLSIEGVVERFSNPLFHLFCAVKRNWTAQIEGHQAQIVQAKQVIGVFVCVQDGMDDTDLLTQ